MFRYLDMPPRLQFALHAIVAFFKHVSVARGPSLIVRFTLAPTLNYRFTSRASPMSVALPSGVVGEGLSLESVLLLSRGILGSCVTHDLGIAPPVHSAYWLMGPPAFGC